MKYFEPDCIKSKIPILWRKARGSFVFSDNSKLIDFTSGIFVTNAGHGNPKIKKAIKKTIDKSLLFSYSYPTEEKEELKSKMVSLFPEFDTVILLNSGSEAVDSAVKLIRLWAKKNDKKYIITFKGSYHGRTLRGEQLSGKEKSDDVVILDFSESNLEEYVLKALEEFPNKEKIAAFFIESYRGWDASFHSEKVLKKIQEICHKYGCLLCFDEIQAGFFRTGKEFGFKSYSTFLEPDLITIGKGFTSSLPLSATLTKKKILENEDIDITGTHSCNPICCSAALANLDYMFSNKFQSNLRNVVGVFEDEMKKIEKNNIIVRANFRGMVGSLVFESSVVANKICSLCLKSGLLVVMTGRESVKLGPPLTIKPKTLKKAFNILNEVVKEVARENN